MEHLFVTPLGKIRCGLNLNINEENLKKNTYKNGESKVFLSPSYKIELIEFKIRMPLYNGAFITDSKGWLWRIEKINDLIENLKLFCLLKNEKNEIGFDTATGEHLDAIEAYTENWILHIGTEDGEIMNSRAQNEDWFPSRLSNKVDFYKSITEMKTNGFETLIPDLEKNEKIHIQYLVAYDKKQEENVNTWLAVDLSKRSLENWIGIW